MAVCVQVKDQADVMNHDLLILDQANAVASALPSCITDVSNSIIDDRIRTNFDLRNVVAGILLGTMLQNAGAFLGATTFTPSLVSGRIGATLVRISFTIGRIFAKEDEFLSCDFIRPSQLIEEYKLELASNCGSDMLASYQAKKSLSRLRDRLGCLSSGNAVQRSKLTSLTGLLTDLELAQS